MNNVVILAGGKSRRMGSDKLLLTLNGETLISSAVNRFSEFFNVSISVSDEGGKYPDVNCARITDIHPGTGPLSGLHAVLCTVPGDGVFLTAADMPFSDPKAALRIIELCGEKEACVIKHSGGKIEPLFAYYKKTLLPKCSAALESGNYSMAELLAKADIHYITPTELGSLWSEKLLLNVNYPSDYAGIKDFLRDDKL